MIGIIARLERGVNGLHDKKQWKNRKDSLRDVDYRSVPAILFIILNVHLICDIILKKRYIRICWYDVF